LPASGSTTTGRPSRSARRCTNLPCCDTAHPLSSAAPPPRAGNHGRARERPLPAFSFIRPAAIVGLAFLIGVQQIPVASAQALIPGPTLAESFVRLPVFESGIASTYGSGDGVEGARTACGQIFRTSEVQVAHKSLPCGTVIRVEDIETGKSIEAEVTDRGPYVPGRIVDLSWAAFETLEPSGPGLLHVNVYVVDTSNQYNYRLR